ncbi:MAG TPA: G/U mismatch-specific DNA glycosylase [Polyangiales bacterium]|jgi:TDG/mug DNA glycosylase family protein|nr:G/U mismatch-specific DNA glycosylase [Polyangiales bacterium]
MHELDVLDDKLKAIFCGINRPPSAEVAGHNFSSSSNRFWTVLYRAGFTDVLLQPHDERRLLDYGYGVTAVVNRATSKAADVSPHEFKDARLEFEVRMRRHAPRALAFLGKRAFAAMMNLTNVEWGLQRTRFAGATTWILPNPSGLNRSFTLNALVRAYTEFRSAVEAT